MQPPPLRDLAISFLHRARAGHALTRSRRRYTERTIEFYETQLRLHVLRHRDRRTHSPLGELPASAIDARTAQTLIDTIAAQKGPVLARHSAAVLAAVLRDGYSRGLLDTLPPRVLLPAPPPPRTRVLTHAEADQLLAAARADDLARRRSLLAPLITLLLDTGCRISEAVSLRWGSDGLNLDTKPPLVTINRQTTKTPAGVRTIPISDATATILRRHRLDCGRPPDGSPVFPDRHGKPHTRNGVVGNSFPRLAQAAGLPKLSAHVLRHTHASWLAGAGVPIPVAAARLGHADGGALFLRVYAHPSNDDQAKALTALEQYRRIAQEKQPRPEHPT